MDHENTTKRKFVTKRILPGEYSCYLDGTLVAHVAMTGTPGRDNYPWDWYLEDVPHRSRATESADTKRSAIESVKYTLGFNYKADDWTIVE